MFFSGSKQMIKNGSVRVSVPRSLLSALEVIGYTGLVISYFGVVISPSITKLYNKSKLSVKGQSLT